MKKKEKHIDQQMQSERNSEGGSRIGGHSFLRVYGIIIKQNIKSLKENWQIHYHFGHSNFHLPLILGACICACVCVQSNLLVIISELCTQTHLHTFWLQTSISANKSSMRMTYLAIYLSIYLSGWLATCSPVRLSICSCMCVCVCVEIIIFDGYSGTTSLIHFLYSSYVSIKWI